MRNILKNDATVLVIRLLLIYAVMMVCRVIFYFLNTDSLGSISLGELPQLFSGALIFDTVSVLYVNSLFILISLLPLRFRSCVWYQSVLFWLFTVVNSMVIVINLADAVYFHYAKKRFTADEFHFTANDNTFEMLMQFSIERWYMFIVTAVLIWAMIWAYRKIGYSPLKTKKALVYYPISLLLLAVSVGLIVGGIRGGFTRAVRPITLSNAAQYATTHQKASLVLSNPFCIIRTIGSDRIEVPSYFTPDSLALIYTPYHYPTSDSLTRKNVVIFTLESFSAEHSALLNPDLYPDGGGFTPFLDSLMRYSYVFANAYSNGRKSIDALPSILTSIPSYKKPFVLLPSALGEMKGLPSLLADEGYYTSFFCGSQRNSMGFAAFVSLAGVDNIYMKEDYESSRGTSDFDGSWGIWDEPMLNYMAHSLSEMPEPFFASAFTLSSHHPFTVPTKYNDVFPLGKTRIHRSVGYTDMSLQRFFDYARTQSWFDNTIFVFTADHVSSEVFSEKTATATGNNAIMMFIYTPDGSAQGVQNEVAQQMDLMPTVLGLIGYNKPYFAYGRDVFNERDRKPMATNYMNESFQCITDSLVLFTDGEKVLYAYDKFDTLQKVDIKNPSSPLQVQTDRYFKAILQQYYQHLKDKNYVVP